jgi:Bacterial regulatory protein, Fis family
MRGDVTDAAILEALCTEPSKAAAARALGISRTHLYDRLREAPEIGEAYDAWRNAVIGDASDSLHSRAEGAVDVLDEIAHNGQVSPAVRVQAANALLSFHFRSRETEEVENRLAEIEASLA